MEKFSMCVFILLYLPHGVSGQSYCGERRNVSGEVGGEVTLHVNLTGVRDITWVRNMDPIAETESGNDIKNIKKPYRGRLSAALDVSLVITNLTREDQGIYKANILRSSQCIQEYDLTVYDKQYNRTSKVIECSENSDFTVVDQQYNSTSNETMCSHNSCPELTGWDQHFLTKIVSSAVVLMIIVSAVLIFGWRQKLHPQCMCSKTDNTPRKVSVSADDKDGAVWKINDIYNI